MRKCLVVLPNANMKILMVRLLGRSAGSRQISSIPFGKLIPCTMSFIIQRNLVTLSKIGQQENDTLEYKIDQLPNGRVLVLSSIHAADKAIEEAIKDSNCTTALGFDVEYKRIKGEKMKPGTVQLSFINVTLVVQLSQMNGQSIFTCENYSLKRFFRRQSTSGSNPSFG